MLTNEINTNEKDPIILSIWIEENLGANTVFQFGDRIDGSNLFFEDAEDAMAFKLAWC